MSSPTTPATSTPTVTSSTFAVDVEVVTEIDAPAELVWAALTDTAAYPEWNPLIASFAGELEVGRRVTARLTLPGRRPVTMKPRIVDVVPGRSFTWLGSVGVRGLFDGRHHFEVQPLGSDRTRFVHRERLTGALIPLFRKMLTVDTPAGFAAMNAALADRVAEQAGRA